MFKEGDTFESEKIYNRQDVLDFARLTGDNNPIHTDEAFGRESAYGRNIVHGNFVVSSFSAGNDAGFPGSGTIVLQKKILFLRPVFIGERYRLITKISSVNPSENSAVVKCLLKNKEDRTCVIVTSVLKNERIFRL